MKYALMLVSFVFAMLLVLSCSQPGGGIGELIAQFEEAATGGARTDGDGDAKEGEAIEDPTDDSTEEGSTTFEGEQSGGSDSSSEDGSSSGSGETSNGSVEEGASGTETGAVVTGEEATGEDKGKGKDKEKKDRKDKNDRKGKKDKKGKAEK